MQFVFVVVGRGECVGMSVGVSMMCLDDSGITNINYMYRDKLNNVRRLLF